MTSKPWIGVNAAHHDLLATLKKVAPTDAGILVTGPTGVGKELYARYAHEQSRRTMKAFVPVNCGSIAGDLLENEMFGHVGGAFTGARPHADGLVDEANGGTLFLDEVDALTPANQVKLLRFIQEKEYRRLGEARIRRVDVRIIAATNADLVTAVEDGTFREDLLFRLRVVPVEVPPLCERPDDIEALLEAFAGWYADEYRVPRIQLSPPARRRILDYRWPGNVRELENCVRYLTCLQLTQQVDPADLRLLDEKRDTGADARAGGSGGDFQAAKNALVREFERKYIEQALDQARGNIAQAARAAGKPRRAFFELMRKHGISVRRDRD